MVVAYVMLVTLIFVVINLVVDILYAALDPRVQLVTAQIVMAQSPNPGRTRTAPPGGHAQRASILKKLRSRPP